jgi:NADP-dependent 3-hydroxy acid dehydrogenase YdfG
MSVLGGKVAWITGAGSGIGEAVAIELARAGVFVVLSGRRAEALQLTATKAAEQGGKAEIAVLDVADSKAVRTVGEGIAARHGRVDILINSAGINTPKRRWGQVSAEDWDRVVAVNLSGALYCISAVLPAMRRRKDGLVVNISSWFGRYDGYLAGPAYNATKHAMAAMNASLNIEECVNGIRGCVIYPGEVATPILASRPVPPSQEDVERMLQPVDIARTVRSVAEQPPHVCINEIVISPTWNRLVLGGKDLERKL